jgi:hypothetical protein
LGNSYMAAIKPFRHLVVYPAAIGQIERTWRAVSRSQSKPRGGVRLPD